MNIESMSDNQILVDTGLTQVEKFNVLIERHFPAIVKEAKKFKSNIVSDQDDYIQQGLLGMFHTAIKTFDPVKGKFITHLVNTVKGYIKDEYNRFYGPLTISAEGAALINKTKKMLADGKDKVEIAAALDLSNHIIENVIKLANSSSVVEFDCADTEKLNYNIIIKDANLTKEEMLVVKLRRKSTLREAAHALGKSHEWVRKIEKSAFNKVKSVLY